MRRTALVAALAGAGLSILAVVDSSPPWAGPSATPALASAVVAPLMRASRPPDTAATPQCQGCSYNWAGYAQVTTHRHTYTEVTDTFVVPVGEPGPDGRQVAADWVGIGGYSDATLVQAGIQTVVATVNGQTSVTYDAWTEVLPQPEKTLPMTVAAGDTVTVTVQETAKNRWLMAVSDGSQVRSRTVRYRSRGLSVEAIHERPCVQSPCSDPENLAPLAQTAEVTFGPGSFSESAPGLAVVPAPILSGVAGSKLEYLLMVANDGTSVIATPSAPSSIHDAFAVADGAGAAPTPEI
jgi:hypothetical protein